MFVVRGHAVSLIPRLCRHEAFPPLSFIRLFPATFLTSRGTRDQYFLFLRFVESEDLCLEAGSPPLPTPLCEIAGSRFTDFFDLRAFLLTPKEGH